MSIEIEKSPYPALLKNLVEVIERDGIEQAREQLLGRLQPFTPEHEKAKRIFADLEQDTETGKWSFRTP